MKQKLVLMVLALLMCYAMGYAQKKTYMVLDDGFEWYLVEKVVNGKKFFGAEDRYGNMIVPTEYDAFGYSFYGFFPEKGKYTAFYDRRGRCIVPYTRGYKWIQPETSDKFGTYYLFGKPDGVRGILDKNGKEVVSVKVDGLESMFLSSCEISGRKHYYLSLIVEKDGKLFEGIADANGKIIVAPEYEKHLDVINLAKSRLTTTNNPLANNGHDTLEDTQGPSSGRNSAASSSSNSSNSTSGSGTTTVVVEHHRDPVPFQEWHACWACGGMGTMGCDNCGGSGTKYIGDRLHICSRCNGRGLIPCNICYGNKGHYETVYK